MSFNVRLQLPLEESTSSSRSAGIAGPIGTTDIVCGELDYERLARLAPVTCHKDLVIVTTHIRLFVNGWNRSSTNWFRTGETAITIGHIRFSDRIDLTPRSCRRGMAVGLLDRDLCLGRRLLSTVDRIQLMASACNVTNGLPKTD